MIRLDPDVARVTRWATGEGLGRYDDYAWHAILKAAFGEHAPRPYRVLERPGKPAQLLGYTTADRDILMAHAETFADPAVFAALGLDKLEVKKMPTSFKKGLRLDFDVRVRPVARQDRDGDRDKSRERDTFLLALEKAGSDAEIDRGEIYTGWLKSQIERRGASLLASRIAAMRRLQLARRDRERRLVGIDGPDAIFTGTLAIADPEDFTQLLARGVGRHRSFGFGMLLLAPARG
jgi:CRISPR system Cascade subunit CasE